MITRYGAGEGEWGWEGGGKGGEWVEVPSDDVD